MNFSLLFITSNILAPTSDISSITTSYNCSYQHVSLFNVSIDKFGKLDNDYWTCMFNVECVVKPSILNVILLVDAMRRILVLIKFEYMYLLYSHNNPWIINFDVKFLPILTLPIKNKQIGKIREWFLFYT
jgi:hypothetical protein